MSSAASEPLSRSLAPRGRIVRLLHSPALKALVGANLIVAAIILARSDGWLQPFELLICDALRAAWTGHEPSNRIFLIGETHTISCAGRESASRSVPGGLDLSQ